MNKWTVVGAAAVVGVFAGVIYLARAPQSTPTSASAPAPAPAAGPGAARDGAAQAPRGANGSPDGTPSDPRLAALAVSADNGLIEFVRAPDGRVIKEIDRDRNSPRFGQTSREYTWSGNRVVALTAYQHLGSQVQIVRTVVTYAADGGVEDIRETTEYSSPNKAP